MTETAEIIVHDESVQLGTIQAVSPSDVIVRASAVARELKKIINAQKLFKSIKGREYVYVEGWSTLGAMLGVLPREESSVELEDGSYEAVVELIRASDGAVVGRASAICGMDEDKWANSPRFARRSMATTRATGKAYRLGYSWIMTLAGYAPTPAEEMDGVIEGEFTDTGKPTPPPAQKAQKADGKKGEQKPAKQVQWLLDSKCAPDTPSAAGMLGMMQKAGVDINDKATVVSWGKVYRAARDAGASTVDAAAKANE